MGKGGRHVCGIGSAVPADLTAEALDPALKRRAIFMMSFQDIFGNSILAIIKIKPNPQHRDAPTIKTLLIISSAFSASSQFAPERRFTQTSGAGD